MGMEMSTRQGIKSLGWELFSLKKCFAIGVLSLLLGMLLTAFAHAAMPDDILTTSVQLDLSAGSITITAYEDYVAYSQGGMITNSTGGCIIRQSDTSAATTNNVMVRADSPSCMEIPITIVDLDMETASGSMLASSSCISLAGSPGDNNYAKVCLNLVGTNTLFADSTCYGARGIYVPTDAILTISGSGALSAHGGRSAAGIGGNSSVPGGTVIIESGSITARGYEAPDIGGSEVIISGGSITADGANKRYGGVRATTVSIKNATVIAEYIVADELTISNSDTGKAELVEKIDITTIPEDSAGLLSTSFKVEATSYSGVRYQWQKWNYTGPSGVGIVTDSEKYWTDLEGENGTSLTVPVTSTGANADGTNTYRCKITGYWGNTVNTDGVKAYQLAFSQQPESIETNLNEMVSLAVASTCSNVSYQWERSYDNGTSWVEVLGETYATLLVSTTLSESDALYRCIISASNGDRLASNSARITVNSDAVTYTTQYYMEKPDGTGYDLIDQAVTEGTAGAMVTAPTKTFEHYTENTAKGIHTGTVEADGSLILSRYYDRVTYSINFETNGGSILAPLSAKYGAAISCPTAPGKIGYILAGWYIDAELTRPYAFTTMPGENITLYAKWELAGAGRGIEYTINGITLRDSEYQPISTIPDGGFYAEVSVTNLCSVTTDTLVLATYDSTGKMQDIYFIYANPQIGQTFTMGAYISNPGRNVTRIKAFMLPVLGGLVPLAEAVEY